MALNHARPGEPIDLAPLGERLHDERSHALIRTSTLELIRVVLRAGERWAPHRVHTEVTLHCLEGAVDIACGAGAARRLQRQQVVLLPALEPHSLHALADSMLLLTVLLPAGTPPARAAEAG